MFNFNKVLYKLYGMHSPYKNGYYDIDICIFLPRLNNLSNVDPSMSIFRLLCRCSEYWMENHNVHLFKAKSNNNEFYKFVLRSL